MRHKEKLLLLLVHVYVMQSCQFQGKKKEEGIKRNRLICTCLSFMLCILVHKLKVTSSSEKNVENEIPELKSYIFPVNFLKTKYVL